MSEYLPAEDLEDLYETAPCGYLSMSPDGTIVRVNRTLAEWIGSDTQDLHGQSIHDILGFGGRIALETHIAPLLRMQGHVHEIALDLVTAKGDKIPTIANAAEKRGSDGKHHFTRLTMFKAVDRRTYERSLLEAQLRAEAESKAQQEAAVVREQFIAVLGHDLRNPLAAIAAGGRMLRRSEELSERGELVLSEIEMSVERASALVDDTLDLARGTLGGGLVLERDPEANLLPVLEQVIAEIRAISPEQPVDAIIEIEGSVSCDRRRIAQLASNLLSNAVTHGSIEQPVRFEARTENSEFVLSVSNAGEAIPQKALDRLFQPFFRAETRPSRNGLGLGLFIVSEVAKAHDGTIDVSSTDRETRFTFRMPLTNGPMDAAAS
ncbi:PAS domain-containing sensor histidine kinase [Erythrobacter sp. SD-21]|uniref:PAS domain-containing sensor histidine kinase n=1 Tax=Erythrobacter sp. SD-21 TaxID=161528 RepID=UPI00054E9466|nr:PAS domain-containing sensor histidine kinase [Erythrobacter sp. SD-21]